MKNMGFSWMANPPRNVRKGEAFTGGQEVHVYEGGNTAVLIARAATPALAKLFAKTYNQRRNRPRPRRKRSA